MNNRIAFPFLILPDSAVETDGWLIGSPDSPLEPASDLLEIWDYDRDLEAGIDLSIDWDATSEALQIKKAALQLRVILSAGTGVGNLPRRQDRLHERVIGFGSKDVSLRARIAGRRLSGRLRLEARILLEGPTSDGSLLSPKERGSRLWFSRKDILIEDGGDSRFPVETVSFGEIFKGLPQERAPWYVHWKPSSLHADFSGSVRLYVNSDRPLIQDRFATGDEPTLQAILGDVVSQMVDSALDDDEGIAGLESCGEGSVGRQIRNWLDLAFPGQDIASVIAMRDLLPGRFRAAILAATEMEPVE